MIFLAQEFSFWIGNVPSGVTRFCVICMSPSRRVVDFSACIAIRSRFLRAAGLESTSTKSNHHEQRQTRANNTKQRDQLVEPVTLPLLSCCTAQFCKAALARPASWYKLTPFPPLTKSLMSRSATTRIAKCDTSKTASSRSAGQLLAQAAVRVPSPLLKIPHSSFMTECGSNRQ